MLAKGVSLGNSPACNWLIFDYTCVHHQVYYYWSVHYDIYCQYTDFVDILGLALQMERPNQVGGDSIC